MNRYSTGEVAQRLGVSKTTLINYINDFNLDIHKNPSNNYREFTQEDVQEIERLHALVKRVGREQALKEWHTPHAIPKDAAEVVQEAFEGYKEMEDSLKAVFARQDEINKILATQQQQIITVLNGLPAEHRKNVESLIVETLPEAIIEAMEDRAKEIALEREQEKKELEAIKEELQEVRKAMTEMAAAQKKGFLNRLFGK